MAWQDWSARVLIDVLWTLVLDGQPDDAARSMLTSRMLGTDDSWGAVDADEVARILAADNDPGGRR